MRLSLTHCGPLEAPAGGKLNYTTTPPSHTAGAQVSLLLVTPTGWLSVWARSDWRSPHVIYQVVFRIWNTQKQPKYVYITQLRIKIQKAKLPWGQDVKKNSFVFFYFINIYFSSGVANALALAYFPRSHLARWCSVLVVVLLFPISVPVIVGYYSSFPPVITPRLELQHLFLFHLFLFFRVREASVGWAMLCVNVYHLEKKQGKQDLIMLVVK